MSKSKKVVSQDLASQGDTLPYPWPVEGKGFTPDQVVATGEHILAIVGWVPVEHVISVVDELIELADDEFGEFEGDNGKTQRVGNDKQAARYALLAARLMAAHDLRPMLDPQVAERTR